MLTLTLVVTVSACADEGDAPDGIALESAQLADWTQVDVHDHEPAHEYDQVTAAPADEGVAWFGRTGEDSESLAVSVVAGEGSATAYGVAVPDQVAIPVGVAVDSTGWVAIAVTRDRPQGENDGLLAWHSTGGDELPEPEPLAVRGGGVPASVSTARVDTTDLVTGLIDGQLVAWTRGRSGWEGAPPDLDVDGRLVSARVVGAGNRFVLAGVDGDGQGHLWTSTDGRAWEPASESSPPSGVAAVGALSATWESGTVAVAWLLADEERDGDPPREASEVVVQRLDGVELTDEGTLRAEPDAGVARVDLNAIAVNDDWIVLGGAALDENGTARPALWAGQDGEWVRAAESDVVDLAGYDVRTVATADGGPLTGLVVDRSGVDVELWRSPARED